MSWVITIDGGSGTGKTSLAVGLAERLRASVLPSGLLYRTYAYGRRNGRDESLSLEYLWNAWSVRVVHQQCRVWWEGMDITDALMDETIASEASVLASEPGVRETIAALLRGWPRPHGLIVEGRDMGTVVFPEASLKWFVTCPAEVRATRRCTQLLAHGIHANFSNVLEEMRLRDQRDKARSLAPLQVPSGAKLIENIGDRAEILEKIYRVSIEYVGACS